MIKSVNTLFARALGATYVVIWAYLGGFRGAFWQLRERLRDEDVPGASVTVVIPARNEQELVGRTVASLRAQQVGAPLRIVVVDDESSDSTEEVARAAGADVVVHVGARPPGWKGKLWAVAKGIQSESTDPDHFLLTDADIEYASPLVLRSLLAKAAEGYDLVSVMVRLRCESRAEKLLVPAFVFFFFKLYPPAWGTGAAGGCMLIRGETLRAIGGIESIRDALIDDCALAKRVRAAGGRVWLGVSDLAIRSVREYGSEKDIRAMIARTAFAQLNHSTLLLIGTVLGMFVTYLAPIVLIFSGDPVAVGLGLVGWMASAALFLPTVRMYRAPVWTVWCLPFIAAFYLVATIESAINYWTGRGGAWKGRVQDGKI
jgi:hopene-associated glycosyltransferase HpnB